MDCVVQNLKWSDYLHSMQYCYELCSSYSAHVECAYHILCMLFYAYRLCVAEYSLSQTALSRIGKYMSSVCFLYAYTNDCCFAHVYPLLNESSWREYGMLWLHFLRKFCKLWCWIVDWWFKVILFWCKLSCTSPTINKLK